MVNSRLGGMDRPPLFPKIFPENFIVSIVPPFRPVKMS